MSPLATVNPSNSIASLADLFNQQAGLTPDAPALIENSVEFTYADVRRRVRVLTRALSDAGLGCGDMVAVVVDTSIDTAIALLAVMATDAVYVPIDSAMPALRRQAILNDVSPALVVFPNKRLAEPMPGRRTVVGSGRFSVHDDPVNGESSNAKRASGRPVQCALYTSGTTGRPKGVLVPNEAIINHFCWMQTKWPFVAGDVALVYRPCSVIASIWDHFSPLIAGVPVVVVSSSGLPDPARILTEAIAHRVSHLSGSPSFWQALLAQSPKLLDQWTTLRLALTSGEQLPIELARAWRDRFPRARLINVYSSTECFRSCAYEVADVPADLTVVPIGSPAPYANLRLLDAQLDPVAPGAIGEVCVSGPCVALGYLNAPDLTATRFVPDPHEPERVMFRTGDLARWRHDGELELAGRIDGLVKVRGHRVELAGVEAVLLQHHGIHQAAVAFADDEHGEPRLVAFIVPAERHGPSWDEIRGFLAARLPEYMIPGWFVQTDALPLTSSGKLDRQALRTRSTERMRRRTPAVDEREGNTATERRVLAIATGILGTPDLRTDDSFLEAGGHSLMAMRLAAHLSREFDVELEPDMFFAPSFTIRDLVTAVDRLRAGRP